MSNLVSSWQEGTVYLGVEGSRTSRSVVSKVKCLDLRERDERGGSALRRRANDLGTLYQGRVRLEDLDFESLGTSPSERPEPISLQPPT